MPKPMSSNIPDHQPGPGTPPPPGENPASVGEDRTPDVGTAGNSFNRLLKRVSRRWLVLVVVLGLIPLLKPVLFGRSTLRGAEGKKVAVLPVVTAGRVLREDLYNEVKVAAEFRPYAEVELHAKVSGYLEQLNVDFGDRVKAGQLIARLEVPELTNQLDQVRAAQMKAAADYKNAHLACLRLQAVEKEHPNLVAQQDLDTAEAKDQTAEAALAAAKADVEKYVTMVAYTRITAPFDGIITRRFVDPGVLIQAGTASASQSLPLVCVSDIYRLRLDFPVSVAYVKEVEVGAPVEVRVDSLGGKTFSGKISRCSRKVDEATRTMLTEIEVPNPNLELVPGMYATVSLRVGRQRNALAIPTEAVAGGSKPSVYLINSAGEIEERSVTLGLETSTEYEVVSGLKEGDVILTGDRSRVHPGQKVQTKLTGPLAQQ